MTFFFNQRAEEELLKRQNDFQLKIVNKYLDKNEQIKAMTVARRDGILIAIRDECNNFLMSLFCSRLIDNETTLELFRQMIIINIDQEQRHINLRMPNLAIQVHSMSTL